MKKDEIIRIVHYAKVLDDKGICEDLVRGFKFQVDGKELIDSFDNADEAKKTEQVSRTVLVEKLENSSGNVFTVNFTKQDNSERTLRGYLVTKETGFGRSQCVDLDLPANDSGKRLRQVDHRTLNWIIIGGVKFETKK